MSNYYPAGYGCGCSQQRKSDHANRRQSLHLRFIFTIDVGLNIIILALTILLRLFCVLRLIFAVGRQTNGPSSLVVNSKHFRVSTSHLVESSSDLSDGLLKNNKLVVIICPHRLKAKYFVLFRSTISSHILFKRIFHYRKNYFSVKEHQSMFLCLDQNPDNVSPVEHLQIEV